MHAGYNASYVAQSIEIAEHRLCRSVTVWSVPLIYWRVTVWSVGEGRRRRRDASLANRRGVRTVVDKTIRTLCRKYACVYVCIGLGKVVCILVACSKCM